MYIYICMYICICIYVYIYMYVYMYIYIYMYICIYVYVYVYLRPKQILIFTHIYIQVCANTHTYLFTYTNMHLHIPTYTYTGCIAGGERQRVQRASARSYSVTLNRYIGYTLNTRFPFIARTGLWFYCFFPGKTHTFGTLSSQGTRYNPTAVSKWAK